MPKKEKNITEKIMDTKDTTKDYTKKDMEENKVMAIFCYILPFVPYLAEKKSKWVRFHAIEGMNLFILAIAYSILFSILTSIIKVKTSCGIWAGYEIGVCEITPWWVTWPLSLIGFCITVMAIIGIVNVCQGKAKELPIIGKYKIIKK